MPNTPRSPQPDFTLAEGVEWLRRLAHGLVADPGLADDLTQETLMVALERPPMNSSALRAWLARVLRSRLRSTRRSQRRRADRQRRAAQAEALPSTEALLERVETLERVTALVRELPEHYRRVVLLRYFKDLSSNDIADRLAIPASTVRTQLERALALLRQRLDSHYGDRQVWTVALLPFVGTSTAWLAASGTTLKTGSWAVAMKKTSVAVIALIVVLGAFYSVDQWELWQGPSPRLAQYVSPWETPDSLSQDSASSTPVAKKQGELATAIEQNPTSSADSNGFEQTQNTADSAAPVAIVRGRVWRTDKASLEGTRVFLWGGSQPGSLVDADGYFRIETPLEIGTSLFLEDGTVRTELEAEIRPLFDQELFVEIEIEVGNRVELEFVDAHSQHPVSDVEFVIRKATREGQGRSTFGRTDLDGRCVCPYLPEGNYTIAADHPDYTHLDLPFRVFRDTRVVCELKEARDLRVTLVRYEQYPRQDWVHLQLYAVDKPGESPRNLFVKGEPNEAGSFTVNAPEVGHWQGQMFASSGFPRVQFSLEVSAGDDPISLSIKLPEQGRTTVSGQLLDFEGNPVAAGGELRIGRAKGVVAKDGTFRIEAVTAGEQRVAWILGRGNDRREYSFEPVEVPREGELEQDFILLGDSEFRCRLDSLPEIEVAGTFIVNLESLDGPTPRPIAWGVGPAHLPIEFRYLPRGRYRLVPTLQRGHSLPMESREIDLQEGIAEVTWEWQPRATFEVTLVAPQGSTNPPFVQIEFTRDSQHSKHFSSMEIEQGHGTFELFEGVYDAVFRFAGYEPVRQQITARTGEIIRLTLPLEPESGQ